MVVRQDGEGVDADGAAFLLVADWSVGGGGSWWRDAHVIVRDCGVVSFGRDDVAEEDGFALGRAGVDGIGGCGGGDLVGVGGGEDAEAQVAARFEPVLELSESVCFSISAFSILWFWVVTVLYRDGVSTNGGTEEWGGRERWV